MERRKADLTMKCPPSRAVFAVLSMLTACSTSSVAVPARIVDVPEERDIADAPAFDRGDNAGPPWDVVNDRGFDVGVFDANDQDMRVSDGPRRDVLAVDLGIDVVTTEADIGGADVALDEASCGSLTRCGEACVDLQNNPAHCGECGAQCCPGNLCVDGRCLSFCSAGQTGCAIDPTCHGGLCRDLRTDSANCGACGHACCPGTVCSAGVCMSVCAAVLTTCGESCADLHCVNTQNDPDNCGACGHACCAGTLCSAGHCVFDCPAGLTPCGEGCAGGTCVDLMTNTANCGACGQACTAGMHCVRGTCGP